MKIGEDKRSLSGRWAVGLDWEVAPNRLKLFHRQEGYYSFSQQSVVLRSEQGLRIPLFDSVSANFEIDYRYNSSPEANKKKSDTSIILGVSSPLSAAMPAEAILDFTRPDAPRGFRVINDGVMGGVSSSCLEFAAEGMALAEN